MKKVSVFGQYPSTGAWRPMRKLMTMSRNEAAIFRDTTERIAPGFGCVNGGIFLRVWGRLCFVLKEGFAF